MKWIIHYTFFTGDGNFMAEFPYTSSAKRIQRLITLIEGNKT